MTEVENKSPADVFALTLQLNRRLKAMQKRANIPVTSIQIPREKRITPNTVYNALRLINAGMNELMIVKGIDGSGLPRSRRRVEGKSPSDVYALVRKMIGQVDLFFKESSYATQTP